MFTGIIAGLGRIQTLQQTGGDVRFEIETGSLPLSDPQLGESIAVNGVCLTAQSWQNGRFCADVSAETLRLTTLGDMQIGQAVNLERALAAHERLGGHLVSGHVDGVATVTACRDEARSRQFEIEVPAELARYIARKGSVTLDGVSLTVNAVEGSRFSINIVPHTQEMTTISDWVVGHTINVEVDVVARYLERLLQARDGEGEGN
ncbi:MAG: riboflavin synthase, partial [Oceanococcus sp.]